MRKKTQPRQMCETCRQALAGLPDSEIIWRPTADLIVLGYPVDDPAAAYSGVRVGDYRAFFSASPSANSVDQDIEQ